MPGSLAHALLHCRENMDQAGLSPPFCQDSFDAVVLTKGIDLPDKLNLNIILGGDYLCVGSGYLFSAIPNGDLAGKLEIINRQPRL